MDTEEFNCSVNHIRVRLKSESAKAGMTRVGLSSDLNRSNVEVLGSAPPWFQRLGLSEGGLNPSEALSEHHILCTISGLVSQSRPNRMYLCSQTRMSHNV